MIAMSSQSGLPSYHLRTESAHFVSGGSRKKWLEVNFYFSVIKLNITLNVRRVRIAHRVVNFCFVTKHNCEATDCMKTNFHSEIYSAIEIFLRRLIIQTVWQVKWFVTISLWLMVTWKELQLHHSKVFKLCEIIY